MTTVLDVGRWLERFAPLHLAESWDNVGLLWGDPGAEVSRVMTCLTVTSRTALEAVQEEAQLIISHHPVLFRPVKRVVADQADNGMLWSLARKGISVLSPHTAFDNTERGINDELAKRLGLTGIQPLRPHPPLARFKVVVFTPESDRDTVLSAAFEAGAGRIGAYEQCSFSSTGEGTFFGTPGSNPTLGQPGRRETARELRVELICSAESLPSVLSAIRLAHSYEEPAVDVFPLHSTTVESGSGRIGQLREPATLEHFAREIARVLGCAGGVQYVGDPLRPVERVAIVCGAGDDFLVDAAHGGADVLLTGEARFHRTLEAESLGVGLIIAGHHATERPGVEILAEILAADFPGLVIWPSRQEKDPLRWPT
ncbi:MAG: Nif3-like dinuclear metal center hexameric protein [Isosphaeraceae bacterium]